MTESFDILAHTIGRATNDVLEAATAVVLKHEGEDPRGAYGPVFILTDAPTWTDRAAKWHAYNNGTAEWFPQSLAERLAAQINVPFQTC